MVSPMASSKPFCAKRLIKITLLAAGILLLAGWIASATARAESPAGEPAAAEGQTAEQHAESPWNLVFKWANFLILFGFLGWKLRKPTIDFFDSRSREITAGLARAEEAKDESLKKLGEIEARLAGLDQEIKAIKEQTAQQAAEERERIIEGARLEAEKILEMGRNEIEAMQKAARRELKGHVAELAVKLAEERLKSTLGPEENQKIIDRFLQSLGSKN